MTDLEFAEHKLPVRTPQGTARVRVYQRGAETVMVSVYGDPVSADRAPVRIQSSCVYGEILGADDCDCRDQLDETYRIFSKQGSGVLVYLYQEGRGAGLMVKARAYAHHDAYGIDSVDAYRQFGLAIDSRSYELATVVLRHLGLNRVSLYTNNPHKIAALAEARLDVVREPLLTITPQNTAYLDVKRNKLGHLIDLDGPVQRLPRDATNVRE